jgi:hypothetical protein
LSGVFGQFNSGVDTKAYEFSKSDNMGYNVTCKKLADYITAHNIPIQPAEFNFDNIAVASGNAFAMPSSLAESVKRVIGCISFIGSKRDINTTRSMGNVYRDLDLISSEESRNCPVLLDALNCIGGCSLGAGCYIAKSELQPEEHEYYEIDMEGVIEQERLFSLFDIYRELYDYLN